MTYAEQTAAEKGVTAEDPTNKQRKLDHQISTVNDAPVIIAEEKQRVSITNGHGVTSMAAHSTEKLVANEPDDASQQLPNSGQADKSGVESALPNGTGENTLSSQLDEVSIYDQFKIPVPAAPITSNDGISTSSTTTRITPQQTTDQVTTLTSTPVHSSNGIAITGAAQSTNPCAKEEAQTALKTMTDTLQTSSTAFTTTLAELQQRFQTQQAQTTSTIISTATAAINRLSS